MSEEIHDGHDKACPRGSNPTGLSYPQFLATQYSASATPLHATRFFGTIWVQIGQFKATMGCFRRVAYSASVGLDASMMAWCTEMQTGEGRVVVKETAAGDKSGEASNTIFRGHTPCYTNYSCTGLLEASPWSWPVWYSVVCCVCGAPLGVVSGAGSSPTTFLPPWESLRIN